MNREEAINIMSQMIKDEEGFLSDNTVEAHKMALKALEQEPKTGRWVENDRGISICSCCGKDKYEDIDGSIYDDVWFPNYCPNCGARMIEPQESEDKCKNCEYYRNPDYTRCKECGAERSDKE